MAAKDSRPWIKVSVDMWRHPKIADLTAAQFRTLIAMWSIAMEYQTDGVLDIRFLRSQGLQQRSFQAIADAGLAEFSDDGSTIVMHDYLDHQSSSEQIAVRTNQRRSAGRRGGQAKARKTRPGAQGGAQGGPHPRAQGGAQVNGQPRAEVNEETAGHAIDGPSESLDNAGGERCSKTLANKEREEERDKQYPPNPSPLRSVTRETQQSAHTFSDGTPIPNEPDDPYANHVEIIPAEIHVPAVIEPDRRRFRRPSNAINRARELNSTAVDATALEVANQFADYVDGTIDRKTRTEIAQAIEPLLADGVDPNQIAEGIKAWYRSDSWAPSQIRRFVGKAARLPEEKLTKASRRAAENAPLADQLIAELNLKETP